MQVHERGKMTRWRSELVPWILWEGLGNESANMRCLVPQSDAMLEGLS